MTEPSSPAPAPPPSSAPRGTSSNGLVICRACSGAVALSASACPTCGASIEIREMNGAGCLGLLLLVGSCPLVMVGGPFALILTAFAGLLIVTGRGRRVRTSSVRAATADDAARLGSPMERFAGAVPSYTTETILMALVLGLPILGCLFFAMRSCGDGEAHPATLDLGSSITVTCSVGAGGEHRCLFTNSGIGPGSRCVVVSLRERRGAEAITSQATCSGPVMPGDTAERSVMFVGRQPRALCGASIERNCEMAILPAEDAPPSSERTAADTPPTLCGAADARGAASRPEWSRWSCLPEAEASNWRTCIARSEYADDPRLGCPGAERCCPPSRTVRLTEDDVPAFVAPPVPPTP